MKCRSSFVTNSSSSSFIIAYRNMPEFDEETLNKYPFLKKYGCLIEKVLMSEGYNETNKGTIYSTKEEVEEYILDCYGWKKQTLEDVLREDEYAKEEYDLMMEYLNKGYNVLQKSIDYCDDALVNVIEQLDDGENVIIVNRFD